MGDWLGLTSCEVQGTSMRRNSLELAALEQKGHGKFSKLIKHLPVGHELIAD